MHLVLPLESMTAADKLRALEEIWDSLCRTPEHVPSPPWHEDILDARENRAREGAAQFLDWAEAKRTIRDDLK